MTDSAIPADKDRVHGLAGVAAKAVAGVGLQANTPTEHRFDGPEMAASRKRTTLNGNWRGERPKAIRVCSARHNEGIERRNPQQ